MATAVVKIVKDLNEDTAPELIERWTKFTENVQKAMELQTRQLERQLELLNRLEGNAWLEGSYQTAEMINAQIDDTLAKMRELEIIFGKTASDPYGTGTIVDTSALTAEDFKDIFAEGNFAEWSTAVSAGMKHILWKIMNEGSDYTFNDEALAELLAQYDALIDAKIDLENEARQRITGMSIDQLTDDVLDMFNAGKVAAEDMAETFEETMKKAIMNTFERKFIAEQMQGFYEMFYDLSEDGLTESEVATLRDNWIQIMDDANKGIEELQKVTGLDFSIEEDIQQQGLAGAIKGITEDTAGVLAGQMGAIRINVIEQLEVAEDSLTQLNRIANNTEILKDISRQLRSSVGGGRALGT